MEMGSGSKGKERGRVVEQCLRVVGTRIRVQLRRLVETQFGNGLCPRRKGGGSLLLFMSRVTQLLPFGARQMSDPRRHPTSLVSKRHR